MKNKVVDLFGNNKNDQTQYSSLLIDFVKPFEQEFPEDYSMEDIYSFGMNSWNFGNMSLILPRKEYEKIISSNSLLHTESNILKKMINLKTTKFKKHNRFFDDFALEEVDEEIKLTVTTISKDTFLENMMNEMEGQEADFEAGYINRYAIVLKPLKPYVKWIHGVEPDDQIIENSEANIYLVNEEIGDLEKWLKKNYNKFFALELENQLLDRKKWPQNRNYKMFKQWFKVELSTMIYDLENNPVYKED
ncbi:MAG: hypothetical protein KAQ62_18640 [Cyclobacteriaceae bacterium]|nr:hypothetical protein [Cyclobacteriaceae bacterium]